MPPGKRGGSKPGSRPNNGGARPKVRADDRRGRPVAKATIKAGAGIFVTQVYPDGTADLGRGRAEITSIGRDRLIKLLQADGSEIRILIVS